MGDHALHYNCMILYTLTESVCLLSLKISTGSETLHQFPVESYYG